MKQFDPKLQIEQIVLILSDDGYIENYKFIDKEIEDSFEKIVKTQLKCLKTYYESLGEKDKPLNLLGLLIKRGDRKIVGFVHYYLIANTEQSVIFEIFISKDYRRARFGIELLNSAITELKDRGYSKIYMPVGKYNPENGGFLNKMKEYLPIHHPKMEFAIDFDSQNIVLNKKGG